MITKVTFGNDFSIKVSVVEAQYETSGQIWVDFDIVQCKDVHVNLICTKHQTVIPLEWSIDESSNNVILCDIEGRWLHAGAVYGLEITGFDSEDKAWRYYDNNLFMVVNNTSQSYMNEDLMDEPLLVNAKASLAVNTILGPQGDPGSTGPQGVQGARGQDGAVSFDELTPEQIEEIRGPQGKMGPQGEQGDIGETGPQGRQGKIGKKGAQGDQGEQGDIGKRGIGWATSTPPGVIRYENLVSPTPSLGTLYFDPNNSTTYVYEGIWKLDPAIATKYNKQMWRTLTTIKGPQGATGPQGEIGVQGNIGPQGAKGDKGSQGPIGVQGNQGVRGNGISSVTQISEPTIDQQTGQVVNHYAVIYNNGDMDYFDLKDGKTGPQGVQGPGNGPQGPQGEIGPQGPAGDGANIVRTWSMDAAIVSATTFGEAPEEFYGGVENIYPPIVRIYAHDDQGKTEVTEKYIAECLQDAAYPYNVNKAGFLQFLEREYNVTLTGCTWDFYGVIGVIIFGHFENNEFIPAKITSSELATNQTLIITNITGTEIIYEKSFNINEWFKDTVYKSQIDTVKLDVVEELPATLEQDHIYMVAPPIELKTINNESIVGTGNITINSGETGPQGNQGAQGSTGPQGPAGETGGGSGGSSTPSGFVQVTNTSDSTKKGLVNSLTTAYDTNIGNHAVIEGEGTIAGSLHVNIVATGNCSHAEGYGTNATGNCSHAEGYCTYAKSPYSHAEGFNTFASSDYAHAEGYHTITSNDAEHACGQYNYSQMDDGGGTAYTIFSVGNGARDTTNAEDVRHNAFEVRKNGDIHIVDTYAQEYDENTGDPVFTDENMPTFILQDEIVRSQTNYGLKLAIVTDFPNVALGETYDVNTLYFVINENAIYIGDQKIIQGTT